MLIHIKWYTCISHDGVGNGFENFHIWNARLLYLSNGKACVYIFVNQANNNVHVMRADTFSRTGVIAFYAKLNVEYTIFNNVQSQNRKNMIISDVYLCFPLSQISLFPLSFSWKMDHIFTRSPSFVGLLLCLFTYLPTSLSLSLSVSFFLPLSLTLSLPPSHASIYNICSSFDNWCIFLVPLLINFSFGDFRVNKQNDCCCENTVHSIH